MEDEKVVKTFTQEELDEIVESRISRMSEKHQSELDTLKSSTEEQIQEALEKAKMSDHELREYEALEVQRQLESKDQEIKELQNKLNSRDLRDKAIQTLQEKNIPVTEEILSFVVKDTAEETFSAVGTMAKIYSSQKNEQAVSEPPLSSGGYDTTTHQSREDIFRKAKITGF